MSTLESCVFYYRLKGFANQATPSSPAISIVEPTSSPSVRVPVTNQLEGTIGEILGLHRSRSFRTSSPATPVRTTQCVPPNCAQQAQFFPFREFATSCPDAQPMGSSLTLTSVATSPPTSYLLPTRTDDLKGAPTSQHNGGRRVYRQIADSESGEKDPQSG